MAMINIVEAVNQAIQEEMKRDADVLVLGEDVAVNGGVFRATQGLLDEFGEERVIDTPLSENGIAGMAIGMAIYGLKPVAEIQFMGFIYYILNHIICHAARIRNRTRGRLTCPMVVRAPYGAGIQAPEHHSESTEALFTQIPGLKVVVPSTPYDAKGLLKSAIRDPDPVIFLEPKKIYRAIKEEVPEGEYTVPLEEAKVVKEGSDVTVICWGAMRRVVEEADSRLNERGLNIEILDMRTLSPFDRETILSSVKKTGRALIVHEAPRTGGLGGELAAVIGEKALLNLKAPVKRLTGYDITVPLAKRENYYIPDVNGVLSAVDELMNF